MVELIDVLQSINVPTTVAALILSVPLNLIVERIKQKWEIKKEEKLRKRREYDNLVSALKGVNLMMDEIRSMLDMVAEGKGGYKGIRLDSRLKKLEKRRNEAGELITNIEIESEEELQKSWGLCSQTVDLIYDELDEKADMDDETIHKLIHTTEQGVLHSGRVIEILKEKKPK